MRRILLSLLLSYWTAGFAEKPVDLLQAFTDAARYDPTYQSQLAEYKATLQVWPENLSAILPQVTLTGTINREYATTSIFSGGTYNLNNYNLLATQTVYNYTQFKQLEQANFIVKAAFATLCAEQQDLMIRTAKAYFDVLQTRELLTFTEEQKGYITQQLEATKTLFDHNDATITDLEQARGAAQNIESELQTAQINFYNAKQTLSQITSFRYKAFAHLNPEFPVILPDPQNLGTWIKIANEQNWSLRASRLTISATRQALYATEGGFLPSLSASGSLTNAVTLNPIYTNTMSTKTNYIGLNANWNAIQGGLTVAQVKAGIANLQKSYAEMRKQYLQAMADTRRSYTDIVIGAGRVKSIRAALESNTKALQYAQEAYRAGELTITEILQIQNQLFNAQRLYAEDIYNYLLELLLLKQAAGTLDVPSMAVVNKWLH